MNDKKIVIARRLLQVLLPMGKSVTTELRNTGRLMAPTHFQTMAILYLHPVNLSELAELLGVSAPTTSNTVSSLEQRGWVIRSRSNEDRRIVNIELTPEGCEILGELTEAVVEMLVDLLIPKTEAELDDLSAGLEVLGSLFDTISLPESQSNRHLNEEDLT